jgi:hypothetical protein
MRFGKRSALHLDRGYDYRKIRTQLTAMGLEDLNIQRRKMSTVALIELWPSRDCRSFGWVFMPSMSLCSGAASGGPNITNKCRDRSRGALGDP